MSKQKVDYVLRHSLWLAHGKRCVYCPEPLSFSEMEADHVIPESVWDGPELPELLRSVGLPPDFDLTSTLNLVPAHSRCNRKKSSELFNDMALSLYLALAKRYADKAAAIYAQHKPREKRETLLSQVSDALQTGLISHMDIRKEQQQADVLILSRPIVFVDGQVDRVSPDQVQALLDRPVLMGGDPIFNEQFGDAGGIRMEVRTCREYRAALLAGFYARTTYDIKSEAFLKTVNAVLVAAERVRIPIISYISNPFRGLADLDLLPATALPRVAPEDDNRIKALGDQTFRDLLEKDEIKVLRISSYEIAIEWSWGLMLREICRADLNGDGVEDILCECYVWAPEGTLGYGRTFIITRSGWELPFEFQAV